MNRADHSRARAALLAVGIILIAISAAARAATPGTISTAAGTGSAGFTGDGGAATAAQLSDPRGVAPTPDGGFLIGDTGNNVVRKVSPSGVITTVAGQGPPATPGYSGDGGPATAAKLSGPRSVALTADGGYLIADEDNNVIRKVSAAGIITTVAGQGPPATAGYSGDGGPATAAKLSGPFGVASTPDGGFLIGDQNNNVVRKVSASGIITTVAGQGPPATSGYSGDGGPATTAQLNNPVGVAPTPDGGFLIGDKFNNVIRKVSSSGIISTVAGQGPPATPGYSGDGGPATAAKLNIPRTPAPTCDGGLLTSDDSNNAIRSVAGSGSCALAVTVQGRTAQVTVSAPGTVTISSTTATTSAATAAKKKKRKKRKPQAPLLTTSATGGPGVVSVPLQLAGKAKRKFKKKGKVSVPATIAFSPHVAFLSFARTQTATLTIKKPKRKHKKRK